MGNFFGYILVVGIITNIMPAPAVTDVYNSPAIAIF